jgi:phage gp36-like protein
VAYATTGDLFDFGLSSDAGVDIGPSERQLDAASSLADSYLRNHYKLPLTAPYPIALVEAVCRIAAYNILSVRGYNPEGDAGALETRYRAAMKWLQDVGAGRAAPLMVTSDAGGTVNAGGPFVVQTRYDEQSESQVTGAPSTRGW